MDSNYGVNAAQSLTTGLPEFNPGSGIKDIAGRIGLRFNNGKHWEFTSYVAYSRLVNGAAESPLVRLRGSPNQLMWSISGQYRF